MFFCPKIERELRKTCFFFIDPTVRSAKLQMFRELIMGTIFQQNRNKTIFIGIRAREVFFYNDYFRRHLIFPNIRRFKVQSPRRQLD